MHFVVYKTARKSGFERRKLAEMKPKRSGKGPVQG